MKKELLGINDMGQIQTNGIRPFGVKTLHVIVVVSSMSTDDQSAVLL